MHVPAATVNAEVGEAEAQSLSYVLLLTATTAISGFIFGFDTAVINGVLLLLRGRLDRDVNSLVGYTSGHVSISQFG